MVAVFVLVWNAFQSGIALTILTISNTYGWPSDCNYYGSKEEYAKEIARFESGELLNLSLKVTVSALGETGTDYLGQCFVTARNVEIDVLNIAAEHDMKNQAAIELVGNLKCQWETLKPIFIGE
jgi:hypothetical protein